MTDWLKALSKQGLDVHSARDSVVVHGWLDTGNYALNWAISGQFNGGYPLGHTTEIFGDPSTGKSFLIARAIARAQAASGVALVDDTEGAYNLDWLETLGVDVDALAYAHSHTVTEHLEVVVKFLATLVAMHKRSKLKGPGLAACDSLALLSTEHELKEHLDKRDMTKAGELKAFFRIIAKDLNTLPAAYLCTNHTIANIGSWFNTKTTPGGGGPKFQSSVRVDLRPVSRIKGPSGYLGVLCRAVIDKNRLAPPWKEVRLTIPFHQPISRASGLIPALIKLGILEVSGHMLVYKEEKLHISAYMDRKKFLKQDESAEQLLDQYPELLEEVDALLVEQGPSLSAINYTVEEDEDEE